MTKIANEKIEPTFLIFSGVIFVTQFPSINSFENLKFSKLFDEDKFEGPAIVIGKFSKMLYEDTISQIPGSCNCNEGELSDKNRG